MIQITKGSYGLRVGKAIKPVTADDAPISLTDAEETRLVKLGVAVKVTDNPKEEPQGEKKPGKSAPKKGKGKPEPEEETEEEVAPEDLPEFDAGEAVVE